MKHNRVLRWISLFVVLSMLVSALAAVSAEEDLFEQNFNTDVSGVSAGGFSFVERPADDSEDYTPYTPDGSKNGAVKSSMENGKKMKVYFGGALSGQIVFESKFRYEGGNVGNAENIAYVLAYHSADGHTSPFLIDDIKVYKNPDAADKTADAKVKSDVYAVGSDAITGVSADTSVSDFKAALKARTGAVLALYSNYSEKTIREGSVCTGDIPEVTAPDGKTVKLYTVRLTNISTEYYVLPNGSEEAPFQTLAQAKAAVRTAKSAGKPITVYFKAGTYYIDSETAFTAEDSGTNGLLKNFTMEYTDDTDRASKWSKSIADKEVCVGLCYNKTRNQETQ